MVGVSGGRSAAHPPEGHVPFQSHPFMPSCKRSAPGRFGHERGHPLANTPSFCSSGTGRRLPPYARRSYPPLRLSMAERWGVGRQGLVADGSAFGGSAFGGSAFGGSAFGGSAFGSARSLPLPPSNCPPGAVLANMSVVMAAYQATLSWAFCLRTSAGSPVCETEPLEPSRMPPRGT